MSENLATNENDTRLITNKEYNKLINTLQTNSLLTERLILERGINGDSSRNHNVWVSAGYPDTKNITFNQLYTWYSRGGIAKRIIDAFTDGCWIQSPEVYEKNDNAEKTKSEFNDKLKTIIKKQKLWNKLKRFDVMSGIGQYGCLMLGFNDDGIDMKDKVTKATDINYLRVLPENWVKVATYNNDVYSERYGMPETYQVNISNGGFSGIVHWTRIIHTTWQALESDFCGLPTFLPAYNYLLDLEKIIAASGEGFWKTAYPGMVANADIQAKLTPQVKENMKAQVDEYMSGLRRIFQTQGFDIKQLNSIVADPSKAADLLITLISGTYGIPKRILIGNEAGQLASSQDETSWNKKIMDRQNNFVTPMIVEALIDRFIKVGILPEVEYEVYFPDISAPTEEQILKNQKTEMEIISLYLRDGLEDVIPLYKFLVDYKGYSEEEAKQISDSYMKMIDEEKEDFEESEIE